MPVDHSLNKLVSDRIKEAAQTVAPVLHRLGLSTAKLNLCFRQDAGHPFLLLSTPDNTIVIASPETDRGETWLRHELAKEGSSVNSDACQWAARQQWVSIASTEIEAIPPDLHDSTRALDDLDAQWRLFRDLLDDAYKGARQQVQDLPEAATHRLSVNLYHVAWTNGEQFEIGIKVGHEKPGKCADDN